MSVYIGNTNITPQGLSFIYFGNNVIYQNHPTDDRVFDSSGTDGLEPYSKLASPLDYNTVSLFNPIANSSDTYFYIGDYTWISGATGGSSSWGGMTAGSSYGSVRFSSEGNNWDSFSDSSFNGVKTITLPKTGNGTTDGGYINYYYHRNAWYTAFNGNTSGIILSIYGNVYKDSISYENLVVYYSGIVGPAGK